MASGEWVLASPACCLKALWSLGWVAGLPPGLSCSLAVLYKPLYLEARGSSRAGARKDMVQRAAATAGSGHRLGPFIANRCHTGISPQMCISGLGDQLFCHACSVLTLSDTGIPPVKTRGLNSQGPGHILPRLPV